MLLIILAIFMFILNESLPDIFFLHLENDAHFVFSCESDLLIINAGTLKIPIRTIIYNKKIPKLS